MRRFTLIKIRSSSENVGPKHPSLDEYVFLLFDESGHGHMSFGTDYMAWISSSWGHQYVGAKEQLETNEICYLIKTEGDPATPVDMSEITKEIVGHLKSLKQGDPPMWIGTCGGIDYSVEITAGYKFKASDIYNVTKEKEMLIEEHLRRCQEEDERIYTQAPIGLFHVVREGGKRGLPSNDGWNNSWREGLILSCMWGKLYSINLDFHIVGRKRREVEIDFGDRVENLFPIYWVRLGWRAPRQFKGLSLKYVFSKIFGKITLRFGAMSLKKSEEVD